MQTTLNQDTGLTDAQLQAADERTRAWYRRVLLLMNESGCDSRTAIAASELADRANPARNN